LPFATWQEVSIIVSREARNYMAAGQLLDQIRELYLNGFADIIKECREDESVKVLAEVALVTAEGEPIKERPLGLPLRLDIVLVQGGVAQENIRVDSEHCLSFDPIIFDWEEKLEVTLSPFSWDWCQAKLLGLPDSPDWKPLVHWFISSFEESSPTGEEEDFSGVVHFMSDPESLGGCHLVTFDLGSAPVETFETLLEAFILLGAKSVEIGQFPVIERG
jgi:hypothetical protein